MCAPCKAAPAQPPAPALPRRPAVWRARQRTNQNPRSTARCLPARAGASVYDWTSASPSLRCQRHHGASDTTARAHSAPGTCAAGWRPRPAARRASRRARRSAARAAPPGSSCRSPPAPSPQCRHPLTPLRPQPLPAPAHCDFSNDLHTLYAAACFCLKTYSNFRLRCRLQCIFYQGSLLTEAPLSGSHASLRMREA
jgi:hypothetical protein